jgi:hypothetical protein
MINITSKVPIIGIYKITSPSNKIYIGQSVNIIDRWQHYERLNCKDQPAIYSSLQKYGFENHKFEIVEECLILELNEKEIYWGNYYNVLSINGLNCKLGSARGICNEKTKQKISQSSKGKKFTLDHRYNMAQARLNKPLIKARKPVVQCDLQGNIIREFESGKQASEILNIGRGSISSCCKGRLKSIKGFKFLYK